jgi:alkylation response protein AidB-like acyl-CoA dehydrogenase
MELVLDEDHDLVAQAARDFVAGRSSLRRVRAGGFSRELWAQMAELGWLGLTIPEEHGGAGLGHVHAMLVGQELGRGLMPEPWNATVGAGVAALVLGGSPAQQREHLPAIAGGKRLCALAYHGAPVVAEGGRLSGETLHVDGGASADLLVVSTGAGALWLVPASETARQPLRRLDGRDAAHVRLDGARGERLPSGDLEAVLDRATIALCAEMLGSAEAVFEMTLAHLKSRVQFGVPIGSFQALQHRAARLYVEIELMRAAVRSAHALLDAGADARAAASLAKAKCSDAGMLIAHEAIQMHGGIGMTEEHDVGLFVKRARVAEMLHGDAAHHRDRYARLAGF